MIIIYKNEGFISDASRAGSITFLSTAKFFVSTPIMLDMMSKPHEIY